MRKFDAKRCENSDYVFCLEGATYWHPACREAFVEYLLGKLPKYIFLMRNLRSVVSVSIPLEVYDASIDSVLRYGITAWGNSSAAQELIAFQRRAVRCFLSRLLAT